MQKFVMLKLFAGKQKLGKQVLQKNLRIIWYVGMASVSQNGRGYSLWYYF